MPPTAGLQDICPIRSRLMVTRAVSRPRRAAAEAASQPACPAPITITSKLSSNIENQSLFDAKLYIVVDSERSSQSGLRPFPFTTESSHRISDRLEASKLYM